MRNYITFDNKDLRDFGVYITGQGTFRAPARVYDAIPIPGRNGNLLGIEDRLENLEIVYPAFIFANFKTQVAALRAFLLSHKGYFKLRDTYHPNEYRLAYYKGPFDPDVMNNNGAGKFDLVFTCKPQRFLDSGDQVTTIVNVGPESHTYTGNPASFTGVSGDTISSLSAPFHPIQDLHGYAKPWPGGGGVNKLPVTDWFADGYNETINGVKFTVNADGSVTVKGTNTGSAAIDFTLSGVTVPAYRNTFYVAAGTWTISASGVSSSAKVLISGGGSGNGFAYKEFSTNGSFSSTVSDATKPFNYILIRVPAGGVVDTTIYIQLETGQTAHTWSPYANICPITGLTGLSVYVSPTQDPDDATVYNVDWTTQAGTVYHGTVDPVAGQLTIDKVCVNLGDYDWTYDSTYTRFQNTFTNIKSMSARTLPMLCSALEPIYDGRGIGSVPDNAVYSGNKVVNIKYSAAGGDTTAFKTAMSGVQLVYELATPQTYQLTAQAVSALVGQTYVWSSVGDPVTVVVETLIPAQITNPTLFDAKPLLRVYGTGTLGIASSTITISSADVYTDIDCELMDCYKGSANKNAYVSFSSNDFPVLKPGSTGFTFSGITQVDITPRWFSV